jgi:hypothetical protein
MTVKQWYSVLIHKPWLVSHLQHAREGLQTWPQRRGKPHVSLKDSNMLFCLGLISQVFWSCSCMWVLRHPNIITQNLLNQYNHVLFQELLNTQLSQPPCLTCSCRNFWQPHRKNIYGDLFAPCSISFRLVHWHEHTRTMQIKNTWQYMTICNVYEKTSVYQSI